MHIHTHQLNSVDIVCRCYVMGYLALAVAGRSCSQPPFVPVLQITY
jgi:hypothetical protein